MFSDTNKPIFTIRGNMLPRREIYKSLRNKWFKKTGKSNRDLADLIGVRPQVASTYATGTDGRTPPWTAILALCEELELEIVLTPNEIKIQKSNKN